MVFGPSGSPHQLHQSSLNNKLLKTLDISVIPAKGELQLSFVPRANALRYLRVSWVHSQTLSPWPVQAEAELYSHWYLLLNSHACGDIGDPTPMFFSHLLATQPYKGYRMAGIFFTSAFFYTTRCFTSSFHSHPQWHNAERLIPGTGLRSLPTSLGITFWGIDFNLSFVSSSSSWLLPFAWCHVSRLVLPLKDC